MKYLSRIVEMKLEFPYIYATYESGEKYRYDIHEMVPEREEYKQLLNEEYFYRAKLKPRGMAISWDDFVDIPSDGIWEFGEKID